MARWAVRWEDHWGGRWEDRWGDRTTRGPWVDPAKAFPDLSDSAAPAHRLAPEPDWADLERQEPLADHRISRLVQEA